MFKCTTFVIQLVVIYVITCSSQNDQDYQFNGNTWVPFYLSQRVICEEQMMCNGDMCVETCLPGTAQVDNYTSYALAFQRWIQLNSSFTTYQFPGTHNSHISVAYGFAIEYHYLSALNNGNRLSFADSSDLHLEEGTDQYLSIIDQFNIGIRHIEIDINWGPYVTLNLSSHIVVCHTPVVNPIIPETISIWANNRNITLNYDPLHLSCANMNVPFIEAMNEIKTWIDQHNNEFVIIYYDTKWPITSTQANWGINTLINIFGDMIFTPNDYINNNNQFPTMNQLLSNNKHILIETQTKGWTETNNSLIFYPALWNNPLHLQFGPDSFTEFPNCTINNVFTYNKQISRNLGDTITDSSKRNRQYHKIVESVTKCGINIASPHMINPHEMNMFIWSFAYGEPNRNYKCIAQKPNMKWSTKNCSIQMSIACVNINNNTLWYVTNKQYSWNDANINKYTICGLKDYVFGAPTDGYQNALINVQSFAKYVWLNLNTDDFERYRIENNMNWYGQV